jgi:hypothetical protein
MRFHICCLRDFIDFFEKWSAPKKLPAHIGARSRAALAMPSEGFENDVIFREPGRMTAKFSSVPSRIEK